MSKVFSWWTPYAYGPRREREFYIRARQRAAELRSNVPAWLSESTNIPDSAVCEACESHNPVIVLGPKHLYELGLPTYLYGLDINSISLKKADDGRPRYFCRKCLPEVFDAMDRRAGNTFAGIMSEMQADGMGVHAPSQSDLHIVVDRNLSNFK